MANRRSTTARRYAEAILEIADRDGTVDVWLEQLGVVAQAVTDESVVRRLEDPQIPFATRQAVFKTLFATSMLEPLYNLLGLVLRRRRLDQLPAMYTEYRRLFNLRNGIIEATAISAAPLDTGEVDSLRGRLEGMTGGRIDLTLRVDSALLGGIQVRLGDLLIDGSARGRLERLRNRIVSGSMTP
jgi:F-type H+-transporting ATPase subunit delta